MPAKLHARAARVVGELGHSGSHGYERPRQGSKVVRARSNSPQLSDVLRHEGVNIRANLTGSMAIKLLVFPKEQGSTIANDHKGGSEEHHQTCHRKKAVPGHSKSAPHQCGLARASKGAEVLDTKSSVLEKPTDLSPIDEALPPMASLGFSQRKARLNGFQDFFLRLNDQSGAPG